MINDNPWSAENSYTTFDIENNYKNPLYNITVTVNNTDGFKIASKVTLNSEESYHNLSSGELHKDVNTDILDLNSLSVRSVPYNLQENRLCVYDNLMKTSETNFSENNRYNIQEFTYHKNTENIFVTITTGSIMHRDDVANSAVLYKIKDGNFIKLLSDIESSDKGIGNTITLSVCVKNCDEDFVFLKLSFDSDDQVMLPICTHIDAEKSSEFKKAGKKDFSRLFVDDILSCKSNITDVINYGENGDLFLTCTVSDEKIKDVIVESDMPYYWYNGIKNRNSSAEGGSLGTYYFGKGRKCSKKINLTSLGIREGDVISITGIPNKTYNNIQVDIRNTKLFTKEGSSIYLNADMYSSFELHEYTINNSSTAIPVRRYLIHHCSPPTTHSERDLEWENTPISEHTGWSGDKMMSFNQMYVTKSDACNNNVQINTISASPACYDEKSDSFKKGPTLTNMSQIKDCIKKATEREIQGKSETKQLFTLVKCKLDTDDGGFTVPMPRMKKGSYKMT